MKILTLIIILFTSLTYAAGSDSENEPPHRSARRKLFRGSFTREEIIEAHTILSQRLAELENQLTAKRPSKKSRKN